jgi:hypothetical protein
MLFAINPTQQIVMLIVCVAAALGCFAMHEREAGFSFVGAATALTVVARREDAAPASGQGPQGGGEAVGRGGDLAPPGV